MSRNSALTLRDPWRLWFVIALLWIGSAVGAEPPQLLLAETWREQLDPADYLVSEKLDGVRAYWDGQGLWTRGGHAIHAPDWFLAALPQGAALDGELWQGRGRFETTVAAVRRDIPIDAQWRQVRYMLFELPGARGDFAERAARLREIAAQAAVPWLQAIEQRRGLDRKALRRWLREVARDGGEGLMLHRADAAYVSGRSEALLKLKPFDDAEAVVVAHLPGRGRFAGQLGALRVRRADGREFNLGSGLSAEQRRAPPPLGSMVTYRHNGLTAHGLPRFARFWRLRSSE